MDNELWRNHRKIITYSDAYSLWYVNTGHNIAQIKLFLDLTPVMNLVITGREDNNHHNDCYNVNIINDGTNNNDNTDRKWQDYVYIQCEYKSTKQKIKHLLREENKVKENKIS